MAAKSLSIQLLEATDALSARDATLADLQSRLATLEADKAAGETANANLKKVVDQLTASNAELSSDLAVALNAARQFDSKVEERAAAKAAEQLAAQGVPPVAAETTRTTPDRESLEREMTELTLRGDSRAAGVFYNEKIRPLIFKEN